MKSSHSSPKVKTGNKKMELTFYHKYVYKNKHIKRYIRNLCQNLIKKEGNLKWKVFIKKQR